MKKIQLKKKNSIIITAVVVIFLVFCGITLFSQIITYFNIKDDISVKENQIIQLKEDVAELEEKLKEEVDEDYIIKYARKVLGLHLPEEVIYITDISK